MIPQQIEVSEYIVDTARVYHATVKARRLHA